MLAIAVRRAVGTALPGLALVLATAAGAQTLSIVPEQSTYAVGEEVVVRLVSDGPPPSGVGETALFARLHFDDAVLSGGVVEPTALTSFGGGFAWIQGAVSCAPGACDVLNTVGSVTPFDIDPPADDVWGTVRFVAAAPGRAEISLEPAQDYYQGSTTTTYTGFGLNFFDQTAADPVTVSVVPAGPVPALGPLGAGALALLAASAGAGALRRRARRDAGT